MSSYTYTAPPTSRGFFPSGVTSPNAFPTFHQSPRDSHAMYASAFSPSSSYPNQTNGQPRQQSQGTQNPLKKFVSRKWSTYASIRFSDARCYIDIVYANTYTSMTFMPSSMSSLSSRSWKLNATIPLLLETSHFGGKESQKAGLGVAVWQCLWGAEITWSLFFFFFCKPVLNTFCILYIASTFATCTTYSIESMSEMYHFLVFLVLNLQVLPVQRMIRVESQSQDALEIPSITASQKDRWNC